MTVQLANNATSALAAGISDSDTAITIRPAEAAAFPEILAAGDWFPVTVVDFEGNFEIMRCTARFETQLVVQRGQEGTAARAFPISSRVDLRLTVAALEEGIYHSVIYSSPAAPPAPLNGELWYNTATKRLYVWDGGWVEVITNAGPAGPPGPPGGIGEAPNTGSQYARKSNTWAVVTAPPVGWTDITGKPSTFPPTVPISISNVFGLQTWMASHSGALTVADEPPAVPLTPADQGHLWFDSNSSMLFIWYWDGDSGQWIQITGPGPEGPPSTVPGPAGDSFQRWSLSDETSAISVSDGKVTDRFPYAYTVTGLRGSLNTPQASGTVFTVDMKWWDASAGGGAGAWATVLSTKLTFDNTEGSTKTAAAQPVLSKTTFADDDLFRFDVTQVGDGTARGLKVTLIGHVT